MKDINWNNVDESQEFSRLLPGGYVCRITAVEDVPEKEYLKIEYDIAYGEMANYFRGLYERANFWGGRFVKSYKEKALPFFKALVTSVEKSNPNFTYKNDENTLITKLVGLVLGEEEYQANDGTVKTRLYVDNIRSIQAIKDKDFKVPELKKLSANSNLIPPPTYDANANLPFDL